MAVYESGKCMFCSQLSPVPGDRRGLDHLLEWYGPVLAANWEAGEPSALWIGGKECGGNAVAGSRSFNR